MIYLKNFLIWLRLRPALDKILIIGGLIAFFSTTVFFVWWFGENDFEVVNIGENGTITAGNSVLSGLACAYPDRRPMAVMLAADNVARPLASISRADAVFEMPVTPNKIPRYMAIFQCNNAEEIGSIRSAREDFLPLVLSFKAIYIHWGGESGVLEKLNGGLIDNIDGLKYEGSTFYRKKGVPMPHNGFTTMKALVQKAKELSYNLKADFDGYRHDSKEPTNKNLANLANEIKIDYPAPYNVKWLYDENQKKYKRYRDDRPELDKIDEQPVVAGTVIVMETSSKVINRDYISVEVKGQGQARVYKHGSVINGYWEKGPAYGDKLYFYTNNGEEITLATGVLWVHIITDPK